MSEKTVIMLLCDSLVYEEDMFEKMPLLAKRRKNMKYFNNYYSQAPYTEAAIVPILTASNVLEGRGYMYNIKDRKYNLNEIFKENGYKTYNHLYYYPNTLSFLRGLDEYDYVDTPTIVSHFSNLRLKHYQTLYANGELTDFHRDDFIEQLNDLFTMMDIYIADYQNNRYRMDAILNQSNIGDQIEEEVSRCKEEQDNYKKNPDLYIDEMLKGSNDFYRNIVMDVKKSKPFYDNKKELDRLIKKKTLQNIRQSLRDRKENNSWEMTKALMRSKDRSKFKSFRLAMAKINSGGVVYDYNRFSGKYSLDKSLEFLKKNLGEKTFSYVHLNDNHSPLNYFSYEYDQFQEEFETFKKTMKKEPEKDFYLHSLSYTDQYLEDYLNEVDRIIGLDNVTIIITADHGSSYTRKIFREQHILNFQDENYHIPLMIIDNEFSEEKIENYGSSVQFIPTVLDALNFEDIPEDIGKSMFSYNQEYVVFEYYGPGIPDYTKKDRLYCIRSMEYKVEYTVPKHSEAYINAIYDLMHDPKELNNVVDTHKTKEEVLKMIDFLQDRL